MHSKIFDWLCRIRNWALTSMKKASRIFSILNSRPRTFDRFDCSFRWNVLIFHFNIIPLIATRFLKKKIYWLSASLYTRFHYTLVAAYARSICTYTYVRITEEKNVTLRFYTNIYLANSMIFFQGLRHVTGHVEKYNTKIPECRNTNMCFCYMRYA